MHFEIDTLADIGRKMDAIKAHSSKGFFTNYFRQAMTGNKLLSFQTQCTILFINNEFDFFRLYYFTTDLSDLGQILKGLEFKGTIVVSYLDKKFDENICSLFLGSGFKEIATYQRMTNANLRLRHTNKALQLAQPEDLDELYSDQFTVFNKYTDHLPTKERLADFIVKQQVIINKKLGKILGCIVFQIQGKLVNFNHLYNRSDNNFDTLFLLMNFYGMMHERGICSGFLWVNSTNVNVIKMHHNFGWTFDGLQDRFYLWNKY